MPHRHTQAVYESVILIIIEQTKRQDTTHTHKYPSKSVSEEERKGIPHTDTHELITTKDERWRNNEKCLQKSNNNNDGDGCGDAVECMLMVMLMAIVFVHCTVQ